MAYNRNGYYVRAGAIQEITDKYYQPERHDRCYKWVWRKYVHPTYGIGYQAYLRYVNCRIPENAPVDCQYVQLSLDFND